MNETDYRQLASALPQLSQTQLSDLLKRAKCLSRPDQPLRVGQSDFGDRVVNCVVEVMGRLGVETPSFGVLRNSSAFTQSRPKMADVQKFLVRATDRKVMQDAILKTGIDLLYKDLANWKNFTVTSHTLLQQIDRVPGTLNRHFPGYAVAGMLDKIIRQGDK